MKIWQLRRVSVEKKISSLVNLLVRATRDEPPTVPFGEDGPSSLPNQPPIAANGCSHLETFDAYLVSEALWSQWTAVVRKSGLGNETIGRVADSLRRIPTVIWTKTLGEYENLTLSQIRGLRTHGEKRVRCVMEVMHKAYSVVQQHPEEQDAVIRRQLGSQRILKVARWVDQQIHRDCAPTAIEVRQHLAEPILKQIESDCGETVCRVARQRLGMEGEILSVREQAQMIGVTRARIYQLLEDCHKVIDVRWPAGRSKMDHLTAKIGSLLGEGDFDDASIFISTRQLCFPERSQIERLDRAHGMSVSAPHFAKR